jgi:hypothetical protein
LLCDSLVYCCSVRVLISPSSYCDWTGTLPVVRVGRSVSVLDAKVSLAVVPVRDTKLRFK